AREDLLFRDRLDQPHPEDERNVEAHALRRLGRERLPLDPVRPQERRRLDPHVLTAGLRQRVAAVRRREAARARDELFARPADGGQGVARAALVLVEEWAEPFFRCEDLVEERAAGVETAQLLGRQPGERLADPTGDG